MEGPNPQRHSTPVRAEALPPLSDAEKALQEGRNTLQQYDRMSELIDDQLRKAGPFRLRPHVIQELNRLSIQKIEVDAGRWRDVPMRIDHSHHEPPLPADVPRFIDEMCDYVNDNWEIKSAIHLASYVMWRLNWIHPFIDGNGRTTRAISYYVLCTREGFRIPGVKTIPELVAENKSPYYDALEIADDAFEKGKIDVSKMEHLLKNLYAKQMLEAVERAGSADGRTSSAEPSSKPEIVSSGGSKLNGTDGLNPYLSILREAIVAVPQVKWALGVVGVISAIGLVLTGLKISPLVALVGFPIALVFMAALVGFAYGVRSFANAGSKQTLFLIWFSLIVFMMATISVFASAVINWPWPFRDWIQREMNLPSIQSSGSQHQSFHHAFMFDQPTFSIAMPTGQSWNHGLSSLSETDELKGKTIAIAKLKVTLQVNNKEPQRVCCDVWVYVGPSPFGFPSNGGSAGTGEYPPWDESDSAARAPILVKFVIGSGGIPFPKGPQTFWAEYDFTKQQAYGYPQIARVKQSVSQEVAVDSSLYAQVLVWNGDPGINLDVTAIRLEVEGTDH
jgi:fido (protein-threonine AMPylation protein)